MFGEHSLSPYEIGTGHPVCLDEGAYNTALLKGDDVHCCQWLIHHLKENNTLITDSLHSALPGNGDFKDHVLQPGDFCLSEDTSKERHQGRCWKVKAKEILRAGCDFECVVSPTDLWAELTDIECNLCPNLCMTCQLCRYRGNLWGNRLKKNHNRLKKNLRS